MSKHTPGPWMVLDTRYKGEECITIALDGPLACN